MRGFGVVVVALGVIVGAECQGASPAEDPTAEADYKKFEGTWTFESVEVEGKAIPIAAFKDSKLILKGKDFTAIDTAGTLHGTYKLDASKSPRSIDVTFTDGPDAGKTMLGIYELKDDTYKVCIGMAEKPRPSGFVSRPSSGHVLETLKRQKP
jgi:uncharacterized protein (TIGR03067 family)